MVPRQIAAGRLMLLALTLAMAVLAFLAWRNGGPLFSLTIAWLVCLTPVAIGIINYEYLAYATNLYVWMIGLAVIGFVLGTAGAASLNPAPAVGPQRDHDWDADLAKWLPVAKFCLVASAFAILNTLLNFRDLGIGVGDLAVIREGVITAESANIYARLAAITTWACFLCFAFAIYFRHKLTLGQFAMYASTSVGIFLSTLTVAGRGSVFQFVLLTLFLETMRARKLPTEVAKRQFATRMAILALGGAFIVYVTMNRSAGNDDLTTKADLYLRYFSAYLNPTLEQALTSVSYGVRDFVAETIIYISHPAPLFSVFVEIDFGPLAWGIHDFPFVFRQFEPFFNYSVLEVYNQKTFFLTGQGVIGVGWVTSLASLLLDYGPIGMFIFLFGQGFAGQWAWSRVRQGRGFGSVLVAVLFMVAAVYLPYMPLFSDTNMFLLLGFLLVVRLTRMRPRFVAPRVDRALQD
ncbi:MAG TPA: O-antigen polymerase [Allosphingosinicella sp.]|nr:O-antigen polymerase [Allosphingosinicella sp.]